MLLRRVVLVVCDYTLVRLVVVVFNARIGGTGGSRCCSRCFVIVATAAVVALAAAAVVVGVVQKGREYETFITKGLRFLHNRLLQTMCGRRGALRCSTIQRQACSTDWGRAERSADAVPSRKCTAMNSIQG